MARIRHCTLDRFTELGRPAWSGTPNQCRRGRESCDAARLKKHIDSQEGSWRKANTITRYWSIKSRRTAVSRGSHLRGHWPAERLIGVSLPRAVHEPL